ncbi:MAG: DUF2934 domain-containing protein [Opitutus sp.]
MANQHKPPPGPTEIAARSTELWQIAGSPVGRDVDFWLAAESELNRDREATSAAADDGAPSEDPARKKRAAVRRKR